MKDAQALAAKEARKRKISMMCFILGGILLISTFVLLVIVISLSRMTPEQKFWSGSIDLFSEIYNSKTSRVNKDFATWNKYCGEIISMINKKEAKDAKKDTVGMDDPAAGTELKIAEIIDFTKEINDAMKEKKDNYSVDRLLKFAASFYLQTFADAIPHIKGKYESDGALKTAAKADKKLNVFAMLKNNSFQVWYDLKPEDKKTHVFNFYFEHLATTIKVDGKNERSLERVKLCYSLFSIILNPIIDELVERGALAKVASRDY